MTRKNALKEAIKVVENAKMDPETKVEIIEKLNLCIEELPFAKWSKEAIFDACDQFKEEHGDIVTTAAFGRAGLPSHTTIKHRFGMTAKEFRDKYYPLPPIDKSKYASYPMPEALKDFRKEFVRCGARTREEYDHLREKTYPCSATILKIAGTKSWPELIAMTDTRIPPKQKKKAELTYSAEYEYKRQLRRLEEGTQG